MKTVAVRRAMEWDNFLVSIIAGREKNGELIKLKKPELERLILHNFGIIQLKKDLIHLRLTKREEKWMRT